RSPTAVAMNRDGSIAAVAQPDHTVHLWDVATDTELSVIDAHRDGGELGSEWSPAGDVLLTVGSDQTALLWDVTDPGHPRMLRSLVAPGAVYPEPPNLYASFTADGRSVVLNNLPFGHLASFDVNTGQQQWTADIGSWSSVGRIDAS